MNLIKHPDGSRQVSISLAEYKRINRKLGKGKFTDGDFIDLPLSRRPSKKNRKNDISIFLPLDDHEGGLQ